MTKNSVAFEQIPHTADLQIRAYGATEQELFANAVIGMFAVLEPQIIQDSPTIKRTIQATGINHDNLLVNFLSECLYLSAINHEAYLQAQITMLTDTHLEASINGKKIKRFSSVEIKAVTYHELAIIYNGQWEATITFDI